MPIENILKAYIDETEEQDIDVKEDVIIDKSDNVVETLEKDEINNVV